MRAGFRFLVMKLTRARNGTTPEHEYLHGTFVITLEKIGSASIGGTQHTITKTLTAANTAPPSVLGIAQMRDSYVDHQFTNRELDVHALTGFAIRFDTTGHVRSSDPPIAQRESMRIHQLVQPHRKIGLCDSLHAVTHACIRDQSKAMLPLTEQGRLPTGEAFASYYHHVIRDG